MKEMCVKMDRFMISSSFKPYEDVSFFAGVSIFDHTFVCFPPAAREFPILRWRLLPRRVSSFVLLPPAPC